MKTISGHAFHCEDKVYQSTPVAHHDYYLHQFFLIRILEYKGDGEIGRHQRYRVIIRLKKKKKSAVRGLGVLK